MNVVAPIPLIGRGVFPLPEAARLAQLDVRTARRWAEGYRYRHRGQMRESPGIMPLSLGRARLEQDLTFPEMLTLRLVRGFRNAGLGLLTIKRVAAFAARDYDESMPFVSKRFRTDGRKIFLELQTAPQVGIEHAIPSREKRLIEVLTGQENFANVVEPSLFANVDWQDDLASRWWPLSRTRTVVLDPKVIFGAPHVSGTSVPTSVIASAAKAEGGSAEAVAAVADWYGVPSEAVTDAVYFETEWLKPAA